MGYRGKSRGEMLAALAQKSIDPMVPSTQPSPHSITSKALPSVTSPSSPPPPPLGIGGNKESGGRSGRNLTNAMLPMKQSSVANDMHKPTTVLDSLVPRHNAAAQDESSNGSDAIDYPDVDSNSSSPSPLSPKHSVSVSPTLIENTLLHHLPLKPKQNAASSVSRFSLWSSPPRLAKSRESLLGRTWLHGNSSSISPPQSLVRDPTTQKHIRRQQHQQDLDIAPENCKVVLINQSPSSQFLPQSILKTPERVTSQEGLRSSPRNRKREVSFNSALNSTIVFDSKAKRINQGNSAETAAEKKEAETKSNNNNSDESCDQLEDGSNTDEFAGDFVPDSPSDTLAQPKQAATSVDLTAASSVDSSSGVGSNTKSSKRKLLMGDSPIRTKFALVGTMAVGAGGGVQGAEDPTDQTSDVQTRAAVAASPTEQCAVGATREEDQQDVEMPKAQASCDEPTNANSGDVVEEKKDELAASSEVKQETDSKPKPGTLALLVEMGYLSPGTDVLTLKGETGTLTEDGMILWQDKHFATPSAWACAAKTGNTSGWNAIIYKGENSLNFYRQIAFGGAVQRRSRGGGEAGGQGDVEEEVAKQEKQSQKVTKKLTLSSLVERGFLKPGKNVLTLGQLVGSLSKEGKIVWQGNEYNTPSRWAIAAMSGNTSGWNAITYRGRATLAEVRECAFSVDQSLATTPPPSSPAADTTTPSMVSHVVPTKKRRVTLASLIESGHLKPGKGNLRLGKLVASLNKDGCIVWKGNEYATPSGWAIASGSKNTSGWNAIYYNGKLLSQVRDSAPTNTVFEVVTPSRPQEAVAEAEDDGGAPKKVKKRGLSHHNANHNVEDDTKVAASNKRRRNDNISGAEDSNVQDDDLEEPQAAALEEPPVNGEVTNMDVSAQVGAFTGVTPSNSFNRSTKPPRGKPQSTESPFCSFECPDYLNLKQTPSQVGEEEQIGAVLCDSCKLHLRATTPPAATEPTTSVPACESEDIIREASILKSLREQHPVPGALEPRQLRVLSWIFRLCPTPEPQLLAWMGEAWGSSVPEYFESRKSIFNAAMEARRHRSSPLQPFDLLAMSRNTLSEKEKLVLVAYANGTTDRLPHNTVHLHTSDLYRETLNRFFDECWTASGSWETPNTDSPASSKRSCENAKDEQGSTKRRRARKAAAN